MFLEEGCIRACNWTAHGGFLEYQIQDLHPEWGYVRQEYEITAVTATGQHLFASNFTLYRADSDVPADFGQYPALCKQQLWEVIFAIKQRFLDNFKPDVVEHFVKYPHSVSQRCALYQSRLDLYEYNVLETQHAFYFVRKVIVS